ncbi:hypothetical protein VZT92_010542 [Zoarces viviparus]|uniref:MABP domain-containing protein n=1 Tax=Zoarces viviparus TaxID=48416 RepID=A0AAW1F9N9_ZOAVI
MTTYISHLDVHHHDADEKKLQSGGFRKLNVDLNKGAGGKSSFLWYKTGSRSAAITKIQLTFNAQMSVGLIKAGYTKIPRPICHVPGADPIYIWFFQGSTEYDIPIVDLCITDNPANEALLFREGWERVSCDLNRKAGGDWVYFWVKRELQTYICDVAITDSPTSDEKYLRDGYIRLDEDAHMGDLKVSITESEFQALQQQNYQPVNVNLNEGAGGIPMYLWYKKEGSNTPIKTIILLLNIDSVPVFEKAGVTVIKKSLNAGIKGRTEYLCFYQ